jgi:predicted nucleic acid-binding protein
MIYLDASALVKLVFEEAESVALATWLADRTEVPRISSHLSTVELLRACRKVDPGALGDATLLLGGLDLLPVDHAVLDIAAALAPPQLRSLDVIHLASAVLVRADLTAFVVYDHGLSAAVVESGIEAVSPTWVSLGRRCGPGTPHRDPHRIAVAEQPAPPARNVELRRTDLAGSAGYESRTDRHPGGPWPE